ncbi:aspartyl protease family protein [Candidatus Gottesmanbacteria bacterium]|nr:aspartyl protease family protein [Candidatus Gottesmanbacteria bacterium]MBI5465260.1 aspartyl protease family protein [Candidatus Gottesmanbacteria bacterium]
MVLKFPFRKEKSSVLGTIYRPVARVLFWSNKISDWVAVRMVVDTGADYTLLPRFMADELGTSLEKDCRIFTTYGIGGGERVYFLPKIKVRLGNWERMISIGFLERNEIPPLMGRHLFLETFETLFSSSHTVSFSTR